MSQAPNLLFALALSLFVASSGCDSQNANIQTAEHEHEGHSHSTEGPHHGSLIELGSDAYHAELVHDDAAGSVTIYILDSNAEKTVPISSSEVVINITHDNKGDQFKLAAKPEEGDPAGKSARFVSEDKTLLRELDHEHADVQIVITIDGKQLRGNVEHAHDH
jgi:hypothetical protein